MPISAMNSRRFIANSAPDALDPSVSNFWAKVQALGWPLRPIASFSACTDDHNNKHCHRPSACQGLAQRLCSKPTFLKTQMLSVGSSHFLGCSRSDSGESPNIDVSKYLLGCP